MNKKHPVYTIVNECQDCCKCVRHCPSKAIKVVDGRASVVPELCVSCGLCVKICPAGAKHIRDDLPRAQFLLENKKDVYAAIAPSWRNNYPGVSDKQLINGIKQLGFKGVSETALGAELVSAATGELLNKADSGIFISSACPAAVDYIRKYLPEQTKNITPVLSPLLTHAKLLKNKYGKNISIVFFSPCAAKKTEADNHPDLINVALTFKDLDKWLNEKDIKLKELQTSQENFVPRDAQEGRLYPMEGGMIDTLRKNEKTENTYYITVTGLTDIDRLLGNENISSPDMKIFVECLACEGGCVNGPAMKKPGGTLKDIITTCKDVTRQNSLSRKLDFEISNGFYSEKVESIAVDEVSIKDTLKRVGKYSITDELNCGGCGYGTCREFAKAMINKKAEPQMCLSYLRKLAKKQSNALIKYIPAGVVIADNDLKIIESNRYFSRLFDQSTQLAYDAVPGLGGVELANILSFSDLFEAALASGKDVCRENFVCGEKILNINIFTIEKQRIVGAIIQDVTKAEIHRELIAEKAQEVIRKNVLTVQKVAKYLGEHMADTEILLHEVANGYKSEAAKNKKEKND
jgi:iron only hydrogenase large subunit-like protein